MLRKRQVGAAGNSTATMDECESRSTPTPRESGAIPSLLSQIEFLVQGRFASSNASDAAVPPLDLQMLDDRTPPMLQKSFAAR